MNSQQALDLLDANRGGVVGTHEAKMIAVEALRSVVEGTDTPDYEAANQALAESPLVVTEWPLLVKGIVDAAVKGRRLVEWEDTE